MSFARAISLIDDYNRNHAATTGVPAPPVPPPTTELRSIDPPQTVPPTTAQLTGSNADLDSPYSVSGARSVDQWCDVVGTSGDDFIHAAPTDGVVCGMGGDDRIIVDAASFGGIGAKTSKRVFAGGGSDSVTVQDVPGGAVVQVLGSPGGETTSFLNNRGYATTGTGGSMPPLDYVVGVRSNCGPACPSTYFQYAASQIGSQNVVARGNCGDRYNGGPANDHFDIAFSGCGSFNGPQVYSREGDDVIRFANQTPGLMYTTVDSGPGNDRVVAVGIFGAYVEGGVGNDVLYTIDGLAEHVHPEPGTGVGISVPFGPCSVRVSSTGPSDAEQGLEVSCSGLVGSAAFSNDGTGRMRISQAAVNDILAGTAGEAFARLTGLTGPPNQDHVYADPEIPDLAVLPISQALVATWNAFSADNVS